MNPYPIKFKPILKQKIWGGNKLAKNLNKPTDLDNVGESWEISGVNENVSVVANGHFKGRSLLDLIKDYKEGFMGKENFQHFGDDFPLLIKFLDAKTDLSVQVHPNDAMAKKYHNSFGKTEMWYIMDNDKNADIVIGLKDKTVDKNVLANVNSENVKDIFNREKVNKGDCYFIPAGKIHAIGAGVLAAEIQQTSDITYRVYDWDRTDDFGNKRDLHITKAIEATKTFETSAKCNYNLSANQSSTLVSCNFFTTNVFTCNGIKQKNYENLDSFVIFMCVEGETNITVNDYTEKIKTGETVLVPASSKTVLFNGKDVKLLEIYIKPPLNSIPAKIAL